MRDYTFNPKITRPIFIGLLTLLVGLAVMWAGLIFLWDNTAPLTEQAAMPADVSPKTGRQLTLEQKVGQLFIVGFEGEAMTKQLGAALKEIKPGGVLLLAKNIGRSQNQLKKLIDDLQALSLEYSGLPLLIAVDQEGGLVNRIDFLAEKTAQNEIETVNQAYQVGRQRGQELMALGINLNLAPLLDMATSGDFIFERAFQKEPADLSKLAVGLVVGQKEAGLLTCVKHFPGYGGIDFNPEEKLATVKRPPLTSQFQRVNEAKPEMVMTANVIFEDSNSLLPFTFLAADISRLKKELGNNILIVSDDLAQNSVLKRFTIQQVVGLPVKAGVDMLIFSGWKFPVEPAVFALQEMVRRGQVPEAQVDKAVGRIIKLKQKMLK